MKTYGSELRRLRKESGLTMAEVAYRAGIQYSLLGRYEIGTEPPPRDAYRTMDLLESIGRPDQLRYMLELQANERKELILDLGVLPSSIINVIVNLRACIMEDSLSFAQWQEIGELVKGECHADQMVNP